MRGKKKGATSFVKVNLRELNRILKEDAIVIVSRRFAETLDLNAEKFSATTAALSAMTPVEVNKEELESVQLNKHEW
jgi:hypothetical protein|tara:strand:- start:23 stop:253 length:231 start_codon:yes stop_codon:yes gene_type:complete